MSRSHSNLTDPSGLEAIADINLQVRYGRLAYWVSFVKNWVPSVLAVVVECRGNEGLSCARNVGEDFQLFHHVLIRGSVQPIMDP